MKSGIYKFLNKITGDFYIGSAVYCANRKGQHLWALRNNRHRNRHLQSAWNKYGEANFSFHILIYCDKNDLILYEQRFMDYLKPRYNIDKVAGSALGRKMSNSTKVKIGLANKGRKPWTFGKHLSEETKKRIGLANSKIKHTKEWIDKMRLSKTGVSTTRKIYVGFISPNGVKYASIVNLAQFCIEHGLTYQNMSQVHNGYKLSHRGWKRIKENKD
jgi:group I intron endonuclease